MSKNITLLQTKDVHKSYKLGQAKINVLKGVDLEVKQGEFVAIIGASGSGKSTLLHILGALDKPDKGSVKFDGKDFNKASSAKLNHIRNKNVGFVFQFYHLLDELNVLENALVPKMAGTSVFGWFACRNRAIQRAKELLSQFGLEDRMKHKPYQLSGGERQRVAIARALMNEPKMLLADEPTGNLDSQTGNGILTVLERLNQAGQTIIMVTHDERIARMAQRTIKLADGVITETN